MYYTGKYSFVVFCDMRHRSPSGDWVLGALTLRSATVQSATSCNPEETATSTATVEPKPNRQLRL